MINLLDVISTRLWLVDPAYANRVYPIISELIKRGEILTDKLSTSNPDKQTASIRENVAVLPIHGMMTKKGTMSAHGTQDISAAIEFANQDDNINSIVLDIESGGGTVDGTADLGQAIRDSAKPVISFVDSIAASAAYWVASQSDEIIVSGSNKPMIGSIGAMYLHENHSKMIAKQVGEMRIIRAPQSKDKARINPIEPLTDTLENEILDQLEEITNDFIDAVKDGRGDRLDTGDTDIFTGKMFSGKEAVKMGMVDREGTFSDAVQTAFELGNLVKEVNTILN